MMVVVIIMVISRCLICKLREHTGPHYGVLMCEADKQFLKRTFHKGFKYAACSKSGCPPKPRGWCQRCRLAACLSTPLNLAMLRIATNNTFIQTQKLISNDSHIPESSLSQTHFCFEQDLQDPRAVSTTKPNITASEILKLALDEAGSIPDEAILVPEKTPKVPEEAFLAPNEAVLAPNEAVLAPEETFPVPESVQSLQASFQPPVCLPAMAVSTLDLAESLNRSTIMDQLILILINHQSGSTTTSCM